MRGEAGSRRLGKSRGKLLVEADATDVVLDDRRFQRLDLVTKKRLLELLNVRGSWTHRTFDLVMTPAAVEPINTQNVDRLLHEITVIEVKSTESPIADASLSGFFFGATETEYQLADALRERLRYAFVVLNHNNVFGRPFFVLLTKEQVDERTRTKRVQFQVNFKSRMKPDGNEQVFLSVPSLIAAEAVAELPHDERVEEPAVRAFAQAIGEDMHDARDEVAAPRASVDGRAVLDIAAEHLDTTGYVVYEHFAHLKPADQIGDQYLFGVRRCLLENGYRIHKQRNRAEWGDCGYYGRNTHFHPD